MTSLRTFSRRHAHWVGFAAVLAPLAVMLGLQFVWLVRLERATEIAHKVALANYLEAVGTEVQHFYRSSAERALNIPAALFTQRTLERAAQSWKREPVEGIRRLFLVDFTREEFGNFFVYDPVQEKLLSPPASEEALAIIVACTPWQMLSYRMATLSPAALSVDERNPDYRIILNPIIDESSRLVGLAGMILDERYFRETLLPAAIEKAIPEDDLMLSVRDSHNGTVVATHENLATGAGVSARFPFIFSDWTITLQSPPSAPERWARASFVFNMTLSVLLATALMGGIALAFRAADRAMKLSIMKSDFVSNVSHELRTPLASIRVFAELLRLGRAQSSEKVQEYGEYIETESRRLSRLIENILDFSRIESGRKTYRFDKGDLREVVESMLKTFEVRLKHAGFRILFEAPGAPLPEMDMDADAVGQAIHNLLDNAVKYSGESRDIGVRLAREGDTAVVSVRDHGIGIARDEQQKIFERFHRVSTGLVHDVKGSGLGLSIVHHVVRAHCGSITVDSEPGKGSTFSIRLPLVQKAVGGGRNASGQAPSEAPEMGLGSRA